MNLADLCARRVAVWGIGGEGSAMVELLTGRGVRPVLIDDHPDAARDRLEAGGHGSQLVLAPHQVDWERVEVVVRAPGVSRYRPAGRHRRRGVGDHGDGRLAGGLR